MLHCTWEPSSVPKAFGQLEAGVLLGRVLDRTSVPFSHPCFALVHVKYIPPGQLVSMLKQMTDDVPTFIAHGNTPGTCPTIEDPKLSRSSAVNLCCCLHAFGKRLRNIKIPGWEQYGGTAYCNAVSTLTHTVLPRAKRKYTLCGYHHRMHPGRSSPIPCANLIKTVGTRGCGAVLLGTRLARPVLFAWHSSQRCIAAGDSMDASRHEC